MRAGHGFDAHRLVAGRKLILGGVEIPSEVGALGHSDADVLAHAVSDALLGAAALGDLGGRFPDSDSRFEGADSMALLASCAAELRAAGYRVVNVDATIVLQQPRLASHVPAMRANIARVLGLALDRVSVKAKTSEGMGYTGDGTGIAAYAVASVELGG
ncbi:MAG: 2-C-methyl-D-erythritol 2,4-cyclodiphosphate synthase [Vulcanimicrobiaceae bacterium]